MNNKGLKNSYLKPGKYIIEEIGETLLKGKNIQYIRIKKFNILNTNSKKSYRLIFHKKIDHSKISIGRAIEINQQKFKWICENFFIQYPLPYIDSSKYDNVINIGLKKLPSEKTSNKKEKVERIIKKEVLPDDLVYTLGWKDVTFFDKYILFCSPYASKGGLGKRIKWEESSNDFELIKPALSKKTPHIIVQIKNGDIINIHNLEAIQKSIISLKNESTKTINSKIKVVKPVLKLLKKPVRKNISTILNMPEIKSSEYMRFLCIKHLKEYPVYYCTELNNTISGSKNNEKAFIFFLKKSKHNIVIIYENTLESRCSYVFIINEKDYINTIYLIHKFFASTKENKRENIANDSIYFPKDRIYSCQRIYHNSLFQWENNLKAFL